MRICAATLHYAILKPQQYEISLRIPFTFCLSKLAVKYRDVVKKFTQKYIN